MQRLIIATRKSQLALWQAQHIQHALTALHPDLTVELLGLTTEGDRIQDVKLLQVGGKSLFVKELEQALLDGRADIAVHSLKDVPVELDSAFCLPVICQRADPRDAFVSRTQTKFAALPAGARIGTSSLRRQCLLHALRADISAIPLRGNVNTRLEKLRAGEFDAIVLAAAGLQRLEMTDVITEYLPRDHFIPAIGQAALAIECRVNDARVLNVIQPLHDAQTAACVEVERDINRRLGGGCHMPIAAHAQVVNGAIHVRAMIGQPDGKKVLYASGQAALDDYDALGQHVSQDLFAQGAQTILDQLHEE